MYIVPRERAGKDNSNHTKYSKSPKVSFQDFRNKATICKEQPQISPNVWYSPSQSDSGIVGKTKDLNVSWSNLPDFDCAFRIQYFFSSSLMSVSSTVIKGQIMSISTFNFPEP